ncbi:TonB-dependent receptor plug domain-containing protein [Acinetobacter sp. ANC 4779]|uniref:TonB-dependent receptor plug domain-containing protein n=1 Tax=Acinetobacter sp. ANC 4779 TaxID=2529848 RepID=UPI0013F163EC|nr:TonB-dependent receptor plug domain-containing protein [Acinetobacter sp. ANC 4779]
MKDTIFKMQTIVLYAEPEFQPGASHYDQEELRQLPNSQKTITDFLKVNPNVQMGDEALAAGAQGELNATDISIHGAMFYDNKFLLNNVNIGNSLNPASGSSDTAMNAIAGNSLSATVNIDLLCELEVLDSNVSAEYGEFAGGVIKAKTCAPKTAVGEVHGSVSYDYTSSDLSSFHFIDEEELEDFEANDSTSYQKDFTKQGLSITAYGKATEKLGLSLSASRRQSDIGLKSSFTDEQDFSQKRQSDNFAANMYYDMDDRNQLKLGLYYQKDDNSKNNPSMATSSYKSSTENLALDFEGIHQFDALNLTQKFVLQKQSAAKDYASNAMLTWNASPDKDWNGAKTASQGGYGDLETSQHNWQYNVKAVFHPFVLADIEQQWTIGTGYSQYDASWTRLENGYMYYLPSKSNGGLGTDTCTLNNGVIDPNCDLSYSNGGVQGQYHARRYVYEQGEIDLTQDRWNTFIENKINWNDLIKVRLGLRQDYDSLSKQHNFAPRSNIQYFPFANDSVFFTAGWNRYYANNIFEQSLQDGINSFTSEERRASVASDWLLSNPHPSNGNVTRATLDTPYSDESVFAVNTRWNNWQGQLKYVNRDNHDQIRKDRLNSSTTDFTYTNNGQSKAETYTLELLNVEPLQLFNSQHKFSLAADYSQVQRNFNSYDDSMYNEDVYVIYNGKLIANIDRPAENFAQPWTIRSIWEVKPNNLPLTWSNFLRYRSSQEAMTKKALAKDQQFEYQGEIVKSSYSAGRIGANFGWDTRLSYSLNVGRNYQAVFGLTVNNVFDRHNKYIGANGRILSEIGRQYFADITLKF